MAYPRGWRIATATSSRSLEAEHERGRLSVRAAIDVMPPVGRAPEKRGLVGDGRPPAERVEPASCSSCAPGGVRRRGRRAAEDGRALAGGDATSRSDFRAVRSTPSRRRPRSAVRASCRRSARRAVAACVRALGRLVAAASADPARVRPRRLTGLLLGIVVVWAHHGPRLSGTAVTGSRRRRARPFAVAVLAPRPDARRGRRARRLALGAETLRRETYLARWSPSRW